MGKKTTKHKARTPTIVSGGQTGVDRAALDAARKAGLKTAGWCPRGRMAEDGPIAPKYKLKEGRRRDPIERTAKNAVLADATIIFYDDFLYGGTGYAFEVAWLREKPILLLSLKPDGIKSKAKQVKRFLRKQQPRKIHVAGPRASDCPWGYKVARAVLKAALPSKPGAK